MTPAAFSPSTTGSVRRRPRGLWLARELPFPLDCGDRIYSASLMRAVAEAGADLTITGFPTEPASALPTDWPVRWLGVAGRRTPTWRALASLKPLVAATHHTPAYERLVADLARQDWDFVVIDQYGMGWALPFFQRAAATSPVRVHVAHDHEAALALSLARGFRGSFARRVALWLNWLKIRSSEARILRSVDLVTAITDEDAAVFGRSAPHTPNIVLTPGYAGEPAAPRRIDASVPRDVIIVGSYRWVVKQANLRRFVEVADPVFARHGITLQVVGSMPDDLAAELRASTRATVLHGFVDDVAPHFARARIAVVPEEIGGGFKLKFLDYIFSRCAVATLGHAAAGLPDAVRQSMLCADDIPALVDTIVAHIDDTDRLDALQTAALDAAQSSFRWRTRGQNLLAAIEQIGRKGQAVEPERLEREAQA